MKDQGVRPEVQARDPEVERLVADLRHEIALRDQFISVIAHELRNPISPAYMQLEHIKETIHHASGPVASDWLMQQLGAVTARFDRFLGTLNRLLDASQVSEGHLDLAPEHCDLVAVTRTVLAAAGRGLASSRCQVELDAPDVPVIGWWDPMRLEQILGNLLSNASRYGAGGPISIRITATAATAQIRVSDHGIGIAAADLPHIFERFARARNVGRSAGFGIGLWVVAEVCRAFGGTIAADSVVGEGATFTVTLPRMS
ncbi:MAG TPA: HAMP domain-containing sensor histidine kinase [Kofleriaceae bacterium]